MKRQNVCSEVTAKCVDPILSNRALIFLPFHQYLGACFCALKIVYRSQKQPLLSPVKIFFVNGRRWIRYSSKFQKNFND